MADFIVAFLGPLGTYSHQVKYSGVFHAIASSSAHVGVIPQENSLFGSVTETYDALRREVAAPGFVVGETILSVQHCLLVPQGVKASEIRRIKSHEQALGQCAAFLGREFPGVVLEKVSSTAGAAETISRDSTRDCAAICSRMCVDVFEGLEMLFESIQDAQNNFTRFYLLSKSRENQLPPPAAPPTKALLWISPSGSERITNLLATLDLPVSRLDRRPRPQSSQLFQALYFVEVEETDATAVEQALGRLLMQGAEAKLLGIW
ncbi:Prephenate dehydratase domain-containing protein [Mycena chlorophos]|uniref:Prephenate dehydratase domain-containing protein n=1 Tax=Mycena chlorophos TaxID=658473 RepID=A0A8H6TTZ3_MYCCL|nr:Prephenate dehydratase domain-containing protein [Mycena chlorophos]